MALASGGTAKLAIDAGEIIPFVEMQRIHIKLAFKQLDYFIRELQKLGGRVLDKQFSDRVEIIAELPEAEAQGLIERFSDTY